AAPIVAQTTAGGVTLASATLSIGIYSEIDATGAIMVSTTGNATLGKLWSSLAFASSGTAITVDAGGPLATGAIFSNGDGRDNLFTSGANAGVSLSASGDIGSATARLIVDTPTAPFGSTGGNVFLSAPQALHVASGVATLGSIDITGVADLTLDALTAGTTLNVLSSTGAVTIGTAT